MRASGSTSIMMSVSLSGRSSPRAREPNKAAWVTPRARKARSFSRSRSRISCLFMPFFIPRETPKFDGEVEEEQHVAARQRSCQRLLRVDAGGIGKGQGRD